MAKLMYVTNVSVDGYIEDAEGRFDWTDPDDELFAFITDLVRPVRTYLYGRGIYESMAVWETDPTLAAQSDLLGAFADVWKSADKVVFSTTLDSVVTAMTRIERAFDPEAVRTMKSSLDGDLMVSGANLAGQAFDAGLVDECHLLVHPVVVGSGKPAFPQSVHTRLEFQGQRSFGNGAVHLAYRVIK